MKTVRVIFDERGKVGSNLEYFIVTGSLEAPLVCLSDKNGSPFVHEIYARQGKYKRRKGVHVSIRFDYEACGTLLAVNFFQPNMEGDTSTIPLRFNENLLIYSS
ncbi:hypothetical protein AYJ08_21235 [Brevibacillus sp. SKDU10]|uniref:hypothetical protein n=1 Tax=Brevibacillus sp. SKDU10 TaxID=1247872 RepID=UPI0007C8A6B5|nr:hypothetical protein [Brevibacillus sp. SKDU10]OAJ75694.1 hypothetical protein AYJ08_21235 [Brevibacillus sp. SKDU10]